MAIATASIGAAAYCLLCLALAGASCEARHALPRQLLQSGFFEPGVSGAGGGGGWGGGKRRGSGSTRAADACQGDAQSLLPDAEREIQQAVAKAFQECTLVPCRPEASGVAPVIAEAVAPALVVAVRDALSYSACSGEPYSLASQLAAAYQQAVNDRCGSQAGSDAAASMSDLLASASQMVGSSLYAYGEDLESATSDLGDSLEDPVALNLAEALDGCLEAAQAQAVTPAPEAEHGGMPAPISAPAPEAPALAPEAEQPLPGPFTVVALPTPVGLPPAPEMPAVDSAALPAPSFRPQPAPGPTPEVPSFAAIPAPEPATSPPGTASNATGSAAAGPVAGVLQQRLAYGNP